MPLAPAAIGGAQAASDGNWQTWDVTSLVQGWLADPTTNNGLTLVGSGAPIRVASALGAGSGTPDTAPYLSVVYCPATTSAASVAPQSQGALLTPQTAAAQSSGALQETAHPRSTACPAPSTQTMMHPVHRWRYPVPAVPRHLYRAAAVRWMSA